MKNYAPWWWIALFAGLFAVQVWIVPTVIRVVTDTEWLRGTQEQGGESHPVENEKTAAAFSHCNHYLASTQRQVRFEFASTPDRSWDLGFDRYMIRGIVRLTDPASGLKQSEYVCRIHYNGGDDSDFENWTVSGFELTVQ